MDFEEAPLRCSGADRRDKEELGAAICFLTLRGFPPIATKRLGITTNLGAIGGFYGTETVIRL